jgi:hypothetical protein
MPRWTDPRLQRGLPISTVPKRTNPRLGWHLPVPSVPKRTSQRLQRNLRIPTVPKRTNPGLGWHLPVPSVPKRTSQRLQRNLPIPTVPNRTNPRLGWHLSISTMRSLLQAQCPGRVRVLRSCVVPTRTDADVQTLELAVTGTVAQRGRLPIAVDNDRGIHDALPIVVTDCSADRACALAPVQPDAAGNWGDSEGARASRRQRHGAMWRPVWKQLFCNGFVPSDQPAAITSRKGRGAGVAGRFDGRERDCCSAELGVLQAA